MELEKGMKTRYELLASTDWLYKENKIIKNNYIWYLTSEFIYAYSLLSLHKRLRYTLENYGYLINYEITPFNGIYSMNLLKNRNRFKLYIESTKELSPRRPSDIVILLDGIIYYNSEDDKEFDKIPLKSELILTVSQSILKNINYNQNIDEEFNTLINHIKNIIEEFGFNTWEV